MHTVGLMPQISGGYSIETYLKPPYNVMVTSPHFLSAKASDVAASDMHVFSLVNGDADGDGQINLFDIAALDSRFGSSDAMSDLNGDGQVNLFDYVVIDKNFGAVGN